MPATAIDYLGLLPFGEEASLGRFLEVRAAAQPDHPFLRQGDETWTYAALNGAANRLARGLAARGLKPGDRVVVMMLGGQPLIVTWFALAKAGAVEVPINTAYKGEMLAHLLRTAQPRFVIADPAFLPQLQEVLSAVQHPVTVIVNGAPPAGEPTLAGLAEGQANGNLEVAVSGRDPSCVIFTSGTTGPSKGVVISHRHQLSFGIFFAEINRLTADDVGYNYLPFFHIAAKFLTLGPMAVNARMALEPSFSLSRFWPDVRRYGATICVGVGGLCYMLRGQAPRPDDAENTLRAIYAVPVPAEFQAEFEARFGLQLIEGYGSTESNLIAFSRHGETPAGSCGRPSPHFEIAIKDEQGRRLPAGQSGEICARNREADTFLAGYLGLPEKSLELQRDLWLHTGDRGYLDEQGFLYFQDRLKDAIRRRGENISSFEVERLINNHPAVAESAVVAVPSELGEDEVKAVVVLKAGQRLAPLELLRFCAETMPYFMTPRYIAFREALPRTPTQKVQKVELRREGITADLWDRETAGWTVGRDGLRPRPASQVA